MVLGRAVTALRDIVKEEFSIDPIYAMSPGSLADWPLPAQSGLFRALGDVTGQIGVTLTNEYLMLPIKSVSGLFFTAEEEYVNCMMCDKERCPTRRAPYDRDMYERRYGSAMIV
jgi:hypothetical protein